MDIYNYLKKDHREVSKLMEQVLLTGNPEERLQIFTKINQELTLHAETEQKTFYDTLKQKGNKGLQEKEEHAEDEHDEIKSLLKKLQGLHPTDEQWMLYFGQLKYAVEHHVEEEEKEIFPKAKKVISDRLAEELAEEMDQLKQKRKEKMAA